MHESRKKMSEKLGRLEQTATQTAAKQKQLDVDARRLEEAEAAFASRGVSYQELQDENAILKRDLLSLHVNVRKLSLDSERHRQIQKELDERVQALGSRYLTENVKWISSSLNANNFAICKQRLVDVVARCRAIGLEISSDQEADLLAHLKEEYRKTVRAALEREEQARIKAQIREEQLREKEIERELKQLEREREAITVALQKALADARGQHNEEVDRLQAKLAEAEAKAQRTISQAQLTKAGNVYVISNIGSFGKGVFKIGMTRRLAPLDRVYELGSASVPFPFDVHMMIACNDAPALETALHRALHKTRLNKMASSPESVGEFRLGQGAQAMI